MKTSTSIGCALVVIACAVPGQDPPLSSGGTAMPDRSRIAADSDRVPYPNILFVFTDDHASHAISAYGSVLNQTPNIDRLADEGVLFRNCFVGNSICAPSRATILTGKHSHRNGVIDNTIVFDGEQVTFPKLLRKAGYQTAIVGKWHLKSDPTGFDHWQVLKGQGPYYNPPLKSAEGTEKIIGYTTDILTDLALQWLKEERDPEKPFMLMLQHKAPHRNWQPGPKHLHDFDDVDLPEPATLFDDWQGRTSACGMQEMTLANHFSKSDAKLKPPGNLTPEQLEVWNAAYEPKNEAFREAKLEDDDLVRWRYQRYIKDYLRCIASVDENLGRVLDYLDESGLAENTIVIYNSDQGFYLGDHGWYDKRWMYEESLRMPLLVRWPGATEPGSVDEHLVQNIDFAETFLDIAGVEPPEEMQGRSLVPLLRGEDPDDWRESIYYHYYEYPAVHMVNRHYGVRTDRYKLIRYYELDEWELFDLERDPDELKSVYDDLQYDPIRRELTAELKRLQLYYGETEPELPLRELRAKDVQRRAERVELREVFRWRGPDDEVAAPGNPSGKPLTVGARCTPTGGQGVLVAQGGESYGYALYLNDGRATFAIRESEEVVEVAAPEPLEPGRSHLLVGVLEAGGRMVLYVDGREVAAAPARLLTQRPAEGMQIGADEESTVGPYEGPNPFPGDVEEVRVYWGRLDEAAIGRWAEGGE